MRQPPAPTGPGYTGIPVTTADYAYRRQDLSFYVERHNVVVPPGFLQQYQGQRPPRPGHGLATLRAASEEAERIVGFQWTMVQTT